ncbi:MAG: serine hydrolase domain-containing protein [Acholeplasmataceae bacterium]|jgi:CubicO group peptidase (beta-lactamase class C family)|nr:serine hydrolase domain-containing protein [Acholeplasmataceae bacterium]
MRKKKMIWITILIILTGISFLFVPWSYLILKYSPLSQTIQSEIDRATSRYGFNGMLVYVDDEDGTNIYTSGYNNRDLKEPVDEDVLFKIASISKLYMAVSATKLIHQGILNIDDTLADLLPQYKDSIAYADQITLKLLIQHRSGIHDYVDFLSFPWDNLPTDTDMVLELILNTEPLFKPDERYDYSNTNYLLLAKIMDDALGYPHDQFIKTAILDPLDLKDTYYYYQYTNKEDVMSGYAVDYPLDLKENDHITPGGTMVASIRDVGRFIRALNDGSLLTQEEQTLYSSLYTYDHTGLLPGYQSIARYDKENDRVIIMFTNTSGKDRWHRFEAVYGRVLGILARKNA